MPSITSLERRTIMTWRGSMSQLIREVSQLMWLLLWLSPLFHICHSISLTLSYRHSVLTVSCFRCVLMGLLTLQLLCYGITASGWSDVTTILHIYVSVIRIIPWTIKHIELFIDLLYLQNIVDHIDHHVRPYLINIR